MRSHQPGFNLLVPMHVGFNAFRFQCLVTIDGARLYSGKQIHCFSCPAVGATAHVSYLANHEALTRHPSGRRLHFLCVDRLSPGSNPWFQPARSLSPLVAGARPPILSNMMRQDGAIESRKPAHQAFLRMRRWLKITDICHPLTTFYFSARRRT